MTGRAGCHGNIVKEIRVDIGAATAFGVDKGEKGVGLRDVAHCHHARQIVLNRKSIDGRCGWHAW